LFVFINNETILMICSNETNKIKFGEKIKED